MVASAPTAAPGAAVQDWPPQRRNAAWGAPAAPTAAAADATSAASGALTVTVPRTALHLIPAFLRVLQSLSGGEDDAGECAASALCPRRLEFGL